MKNEHSSFFIDRDQVKNEKLKIAIIMSLWNKEITKKLYKGAYNTLIKLGINKKRIKTWNVPGSYELIFFSKKIASSQRDFDSIIVIGSLIKGETYHFKYLCQAISQGIKDINVIYNTPVIFCVLMDKNKQQSIDRSGGKLGNKGVESANTAVYMSLLKRSIL